MTVKELIEKLSKMNPDLIVVRNDYSYQLVDVSYIFQDFTTNKTSVGYYDRTNESDPNHINVCIIH